MQMMNLHRATAALIATALTFRQEWERRQTEEAAARALATPEGGTPSTEAEAWPEELSEEEWWDHFISFVQDNGIGLPLDKQHNPDILCFASLQPGEPSFTLRGQDSFASILVKHWIELARELAPDIRARKLDGAEAIVEKMEAYEPQKLPD